MQRTLLTILSALALSAGSAAAQTKSPASHPPAAQQPAPPQSGDATGHDAQAGRPETAPAPSGGARANSNTDEANKGFTKEAEKEKRK